MCSSLFFFFCSLTRSKSAAFDSHVRESYFFFHNLNWQKTFVHIEKCVIKADVQMLPLLLKFHVSNEAKRNMKNVCICAEEMQQQTKKKKLRQKLNIVNLQLILECNYCLLLHKWHCAGITACDSFRIQRNKEWKKMLKNKPRAKEDLNAREFLSNCSSNKKFRVSV